MTPGTLMKIDPDSKLKYASSSKSISGTPYDIDLKSVHDNEDKKPVMETKLRRQVSLPGNQEDAKVDVSGCSNAGSAARWPDSQDPDATEYSSSFSGTVSDSEHCSGLSDAEVESQFSLDNSMPPAFDAFNGMLHIRCVLPHLYSPILELQVQPCGS